MTWMIWMLRLPKIWNSLNVCNKLINHPFLLFLTLVWPIWYHGNWGNNQDSKLCLRNERVQFSFLISMKDKERYFQNSKIINQVLIFWLLYDGKKDKFKKMNVLENSLFGTFFLIQLCFCVSIISVHSILWIKNSFGKSWGLLGWQTDYSWLNTM